MSPGGQPPGEAHLLPWYDLTTHSDGLADRVRKLGRRGLDDLTVDLVGPAAVVLEYLDELLDVGHGVGVRLAVVPRLDSREELLMLRRQVG